MCCLDVQPVSALEVKHHPHPAPPRKVPQGWGAGGGECKLHCNTMSNIVRISKFPKVTTGRNSKESG
ncbi:hypothetical protein BX600DRAFT_453678 [Xylariales sp. PMI_506]|nr:hypothetical protein BX600DRAFT_453678 [Xylariales sp. PMI_506]